MKKLRLVKILIICLVVAAGAMSALAFTGCNIATDGIMVITRDAASGTRVGFDGVVGITAATLTDEAHEAANNGAVITSVAGNPNAIGYISANTLNNTVKAVTVNGYAHTHSAFPIQRPFVLAVNEAIYDNDELLPRTAEFWRFLQSSTAQTAIIGNELAAPRPGEPTLANRVAYTAVSADPGSETIIIRGSSSVNSLMGRLITEFVRITPWAEAAMFDRDMQGTGIGFGVEHGIRSANANRTIGAASRALSEAERGFSSHDTIGMDVIAVVVHPSNELANVTIAQLTQIFTGAVRYWSEVA